VEREREEGKELFALTMWCEGDKASHACGRCAWRCQDGSRSDREAVLVGIGQRGSSRDLVLMRALVHAKRRKLSRWAVSQLRQSGPRCSIGSGPNNSFFLYREYFPIEFK
jgi:hypothetical protein